MEEQDTMTIVLEIVGALIVVAWGVVRFTKTDKDDAIVKRIRDIFTRLSK